MRIITLTENEQQIAAACIGLPKDEAFNKKSFYEIFIKHFKQPLTRQRAFALATNVAVQSERTVAIEMKTTVLCPVSMRMVAYSRITSNLLVTSR